MICFNSCRKKLRKRFPMLKIILTLIIILLFIVINLFLYCCCVISSRCSREEELQIKNNKLKD